MDLSLRSERSICRGNTGRNKWEDHMYNNSKEHAGRPLSATRKHQKSAAATRHSLDDESMSQGGASRPQRIPAGSTYVANGHTIKVCHAHVVIIGFRHEGFRRQTTQATSNGSSMDPPPAPQS